MKKWAELIFERRLLMVRTALGKVFLKVLFIPWVNKWFERFIQQYEIYRLKKERDMFDRKEGVPALNFKHDGLYLPHTEERIDRLRRVINKRPVAIILHGPSAQELEERINELKDCDICYFGVDAFRVPEKHILQKINRNFSLVLYNAVHWGIPSQMDNVIEFLDRQEDNMFISEWDALRPLEIMEDFDLDRFIKKYDKKLLFFAFTFTSIVVRDGLFLRAPSIEYPLHFARQDSLAMMLALALIGGAPMVVIFGGDGGRIKGRELYYRESSESNAPESVQEQALMAGTRGFNAVMPLLIEKIYKIYNLKPVEIINCSLQSHYTSYKKLSYDETFALLKPNTN